jgi:hypothetical protein
LGWEDGGSVIRTESGSQIRTESGSGSGQ